MAFCLSRFFRLMDTVWHGWRCRSVSVDTVSRIVLESEHWPPMGDPATVWVFPVLGSGGSSALAVPGPTMAIWIASFSDGFSIVIRSNCLDRAIALAQELEDWYSVLQPNRGLLDVVPA